MYRYTCEHRKGRKKKKKKRAWSYRPSWHIKHFVAAEFTFPHVSPGLYGQSGLPESVSAPARPQATPEDVHTLSSLCVVHPAGHSSHSVLGLSSGS